jgi:hypothetical protein
MTKQSKNKVEFIASKIKSIKIAELALARWEEDKKNRAARAERYLLYFTHLYIEQWLAKEIPAGDRPKISLFLSADTIRQYRAKLFPGRAEVGIKVYPETTVTNEAVPTETETAKYENQILETYEANQMPLILHDQSEWFFVGGEACIFAPHDPIGTPGKNADTLIFSIDPQKCTIGIHGKTKVYGMHEQTITAQQARKLDWVKLAADISDDAVLSDIYYFDLFNYCRIINNDKESAKVIPNPYAPGYEVPYFWMPNNAKPGSQIGNSELRHLRTLDKELNFRLSDYAERLRSGVLGPVFVSGAGNNKNISLDKDFINYLGLGGKAERLALSGDGKEYLDYFEFLLSIYQKKTTITDDVIGGKNTNAASSGIALQYKFLSLQELIDEKRLVWDNGLKQLNKTILYYKFGAGKKYRNKPIYVNALPTDESVSANNNVKLVEAGLKARESAIDELNPNESAQDIIKKINLDKTANPDFYKKAPQNPAEIPKKADEKKV